MASFAYTYDANKNKSTEALGAPMANYGFNSTTYDNEDRLTAWSRPDGKTQSWDLSAAGDWNSFTENGTTQDRDHSPVHALTRIDGVSSLAYDAKGNLITNSNGQTYVWDFDNRMSSAAVSGNTHNYTYDALGRRVSKTVQSGTASVTTVYVCLAMPISFDPQAGQVVAEYTVSSTSDTLARKFVYATYIDTPVVMLAASNGSEKGYYYHQDGHENVVALTDSVGSVVERYAYTSYGSCCILDASGATILQASGVSNPYVHIGRTLDQETGLYYYRSRYYSASLGRFIGRDPIGCEWGENNPYTFLDSSPLSGYDASGLTVLGEGGLSVPKECSINLFFIHHVGGSNRPDYADQLFLKMLGQALKDMGYKPPKGVDLNHLTIEQALKIVRQLKKEGKSVLPPNIYMGGFGCYPGTLLALMKALFGDDILVGGEKCTGKRSFMWDMAPEAAKQIANADKKAEGMCKCCPDGIDINVVCDRQLTDNLRDHIKILENWGKKYWTREKETNFFGTKTVAEEIQSSKDLLQKCDQGPYKIPATRP